MKKFFCSAFLIAMLCYGANNVYCQVNPSSQEHFEMDALKKYNALHPALSPIPPPAPAENEALLGAHLTRSAMLLEMSTRERRFPVRIIIYGQSITGSKAFTDDVADYLKNKFPYADITLENKCIGGFGGEAIIRTATHDLYNSRADLIIFHVYGGEKGGELEQLFRNIRKYTTADILLMNHHLTGTQKAPIESTARYLRYIANKYDCELADISYEWPKYLADNKMVLTDLLRDGTHPNANGNWLLTQLVCRHIKYNPLFPSGSYNTVQTLNVATVFEDSPAGPITFAGKPWDHKNGMAIGQSPDSKLKLTFYGSRVDVIAGQIPKMLKTGSVRILLDARNIEENHSLLAITRPSPGPGTWFPLVRRVSFVKPLILEDWTLRVDKVSADSTEYTFSVKGSKTGFDGSGSNKKNFVSNSGRVVIDSIDFMFIPVRKTFKVVIPVGFESHWSVIPLYEQTYHPEVGSDRSKVYKTTLVQGLNNNTLHTLELVPVGDGPVPIEAFEIHRPPLR
ncbi:MAG TPA: SGNH/GDSL hydrolase family protein [Mucilaginibacter sp.]|jgi:hypothetical protein|nr:SGNH/GDSL hydrolase family protein [Mucilaginibacter sp.]